ncbi:MAG: glycosyltransferase family 2 protein [Thermomicrobiales bacterium]
MSQSHDRKLTATVVIPCLNEEAAIGDLIAEVLTIGESADLLVTISEIIVVDNGSTDRTAEVARDAGAMVVAESRMGYGRACLTGVLAAVEVDLIVLMDGDRSDRPAELPLLLAPILKGEADLVLGSRMLGSYEPGSLLPQQIFGNRVATLLFRLVYRVRISDIGPFRVIRRDQLIALGMREMTYGWSIEMIARAVRSGLHVVEVPVTYRKRAGGVSKVSGNVRASLKAGYRILGAILRGKSDHRPVPADLRIAMERATTE